MPASRRVAVFGFVLLGVVATAASSPGAEPVFLRGHLVTPQHVVFGKVESVRGEYAVLNLGFAHGLRTTETLLVIRRIDEELIPIAGLTVVATEGNHSRARVEGPFEVQPNDFALIHASHLDLWGGTPRLTGLAREILVRRQGANGYSTFDTDAELVEEVGRDDDYRGRQYQGTSLESIRREAIGKAGPLALPIGAVAPLPIIDPSQSEGEDAAIAGLDATSLELSYFVEIAKSPSLLIPRMSTGRLQTLRPTSAQTNFDDETAPLLRSNLLAWVRKSILVRD